MISPTRAPLQVVFAFAGLTAGVLVMPLVMPWTTSPAWGQAAPASGAAGAATAPAAPINNTIPALAPTVKAGSPGPAELGQINQYITAHIGNILSADPLA